MKYFFIPIIAFFAVYFSSCEDLFYESHPSYVYYKINNMSSDTLFVSSYICYIDMDVVYCYRSQPGRILYPNDSIKSFFHSDEALDSWTLFFKKEKIDSVMIVLSSTPLNYIENHCYKKEFQDSSIVKIFSYDKDKAKNFEPRFVYP